MRPIKNSETNNHKGTAMLDKAIIEQLDRIEIKLDALMGGGATKKKAASKTPKTNTIQNYRDAIPKIMQCGKRMHVTSIMDALNESGLMRARINTEAAIYSATKLLVNEGFLVRIKAGQFVYPGNPE